MLTLCMLIISVVNHAQEKNIKTESVKLDNLITHIVENYSITKDSTTTKNITFLIETYNDTFNAEDKVLLKQAFKLLTKRVTKDDFVSIITYSKINGVALEQATGTDIKKLLYVVENVKFSIKTLEKDGIETAYTYMNDNFEEDAINTIIMVRIPNRTIAENSDTDSKSDKKNKKKKSNAVVLTAISLLPEIIAVIKN